MYRLLDYTDRHVVHGRFGATWQDEPVGCQGLLASL